MDNKETERKIKSFEGRKVHAKAEYEREHGSLTEALKLSEEAMVAYQKDGDYQGMAEVLAARVIVLRHLSRQTKDTTYLILAKKTAEAAVEIVGKESLGVKALPIFNLAEVLEDMGQYVEAVDNYKTAIKFLPANTNPATAANFGVHLAICEYKAGDETGAQRAEIALALLKSVTHEDKYTSDVWVSGGHMRIADAVKANNPIQAKNHLLRAKIIIDSNPQLVLRREQFEELASVIL